MGTQRPASLTLCTGLWGISFGPIDMTSSNTLLFLVLCAIGESLSDLPKCNPDHRDCSCADKSYLGCDEPESFDKLHVSNLQECIMSCDILNSLGNCDWIIFYNTAGEEANCRLFMDAVENMEEYLGSCERVGLPLRREDGSCMAPSDTCNPLVCPNDCVPCDDTDKCNVNFHETECSMISPSASEFTGCPDEEFCSNICAMTGLSNPITYAIFVSAAEKCSCYETGERRFGKKVVKHGFSYSDIANCQNGEEFI